MPLPGRSSVTVAMTGPALAQRGDLRMHGRVGRDVDPVVDDPARARRRRAPSASRRSASQTQTIRDASGVSARSASAYARRCARLSK